MTHTIQTNATDKFGNNNNNNNNTMPRRGSPHARCTVVGCRCEWIVVSKNRHQYCHEHMTEANALHSEYKAINAVAVATFEDAALDHSIRLREEYARKFLDYEDTGAHRAYIGILKRVLAVNAKACRRVAFRRRALYNHLMTNSEYFSDFAGAQGGGGVRLHSVAQLEQFVNAPSLSGALGILF